jgi:hypothetical protein
MSEFLKKYSSLIASVVVFLALGVIAFLINKSESSELTWFWGALVFLSIWPIETALFTFLKPTFLVHLAGSLILAALLLLANYLQTSVLTWSILLAPACLLWPIGFVVWDFIKKLTKSNLLASLIGWFVISLVAVIAEWVFTKKFTWSLPLVVVLAFWPAASIAFIAVDEKSVDNPSPEQPEKEVSIEESQKDNE